MKIKTENKVSKEPLDEVDVIIEFECPIRGTVKQTVKVKKYAYTGSPTLPMRW